MDNEYGRVRGIRRRPRCSCRSCTGPPGGSRAARILKNPFAVFAGFVVPLALVSTSRSARAGQAGTTSLAVERDGGVAAPPLLAGASGGPVRAGVGTARSAPSARGTRRLRAAHVTLTQTASGLSAGDRVFVAPAPGSVPERLVSALVAADRIATLPYLWGGGHGSFDAAGYDCSGSVSYVLHAAAGLSAPQDSSELEAYGEAGPGRWISVYANAGHVFMTLGGMRYDTSGLSSSGTRWHPLGQIPAGYVVRHPVGL